MPTSIDLSNVVELRSLSDIVETLNDSARGIVERWLIVGATARDLILHHAYHLPISRATIDLDIAVAVPSWLAFEVLQKELLKRGQQTVDRPPSTGCDQLRERPSANGRIGGFE